MGITLIASLVSVGTGLSAQSELSLKFDRGYSMWKCAALVQWAKSEPKMQYDLFLQGFDDLEEFATAWFDEKLTVEYLEVVPNTVKRGLPHSISPEFLMGFIWSSATNRSYLGISEQLDQPKTTEIEEAWALQRQEAAKQFKEKNCAFLAN